MRASWSSVVALALVSVSLVAHEGIAPVTRDIRDISTTKAPGALTGCEYAGLVVYDSGIELATWDETTGNDDVDPDVGDGSPSDDHCTTRDATGIAGPGGGLAFFEAFDLGERSQCQYVSLGLSGLGVLVSFWSETNRVPGLQTARVDNDMPADEFCALVPRTPGA